MIALELLERAYADDRKVTPDEMRGKLGEIPMDGFKRIFRINRVMEKAISHEVTEIIGGRAPKGWYLAKKNPEIITGCNRL